MGYLRLFKSFLSILFVYVEGCYVVCGFVYRKLCENEIVYKVYFKIVGFWFFRDDIVVFFDLKVI